MNLPPKKTVLRKYFLENRISTEVGQRIWHYLKSTHFSLKTRTQEKDVQILKLLNSNLRRDLREELYRPHLLNVPIFACLFALSPETSRELCDRAATQIFVPHAEELFVEGKTGDSMFCILDGCLEYQHAHPSLQTEVGSREWICEPVLWLDWHYCATAVAKTYCEVIGFRSAESISIVQSMLMPTLYLTNYAKAFRDYMINSGPNWNTDIWKNVEELHELAVQVWQENEESFPKLPSRVRAQRSSQRSKNSWISYKASHKTSKISTGPAS